MSFVGYDELEDNDFNDDNYVKTGFSGFEVAYSSASKTPMKKSTKRQYQVKKKLDSLKERKLTERESYSNYDDWN